MNTTTFLVEEAVMDGRFALMCLNLTQTDCEIIHSTKTYIRTFYDKQVLYDLRRWLSDVGIDSTVCGVRDSNTSPDPSENEGPTFYEMAIDGDLKDIAWNIWLACDLHTVPTWIYSQWYESWISYYFNTWGMHPQEHVNCFTSDDIEFAFFDDDDYEESNESHVLASMASR